MQAVCKRFLIAAASFTWLFGVVPLGPTLPRTVGAEPAPAAKGDEPQAVITGKIVDEAKKPVVGATVTALNWKKSQPVKSNSDGLFRLPLGESRKEWISATLLVQGPNGALGFLEVEQSKPAPVEVVVKTPREVAVQVSAGDGKPVEGAEVSVQAAYYQIAGGRTDAEGRWTGRIPVDAASATAWSVVALKGKVGFDYVSKRQRGKEQQKNHLPGQVHLKLDGARTLQVKTVDAAGKPIAGVTVYPWLILKPNREEQVNLTGIHDVHQTTGKDGVALFDWLPERFTNDLPIVVYSEDYYSVEGYSTYLTEEKPVKELTIRMLPLERLSGRITHADGKPAVGIHVQAEGQGAGENGFRGATQTDADGRYAFKVHSEQAYILAVGNERWAAPYRGGLIVHAGKPVADVDFVLGPATRVHGRVMSDKGDQAIPDARVNATINLRNIPAELRKNDDRSYYQLSMNIPAHMEKDGRFELFLGPGNYELTVYTRDLPRQPKVVKFTIPAENPPRELVQDFRIARPETKTLAGRVVDEKGRPMAEAVIKGFYASAKAPPWFRDLKTDAEGRFRVERLLEPLVLHALTADGKNAGIARPNAEAAKVEIVVRSVASASGRLLDLQGKPVAQAELYYGIGIDRGDPDGRLWVTRTAFGGTAVTDAEGRFTLNGLVPGEKYNVDCRLERGSFRMVTTVSPKDATALALGELRVDTAIRKPPAPYVPPPAADVTAKAFVPSKPGSPLERKERLLNEAKREYTRPLLLFGQPKDAACIDLFRLFNERTRDDEADRDEERKPPRPTPQSLRWEFDLAALDTEQADVGNLAEALGVKVGKDRPPVLAVLNTDGTLAATYALSLGAKQQLDSAALTAFLLKNKLATRDAEQLLAEALKQAKAEDKRVFFIASASWCGPCRLLARFLEPWKTELDRHYVFVKLDVSRDEHAGEVTRRIQKGNDGGVPSGIPWYAILDADSKVLITSTAPDLRQGKPGNIGFPGGTTGVEHFLKMLSQTAARLESGKMAEIRESLLKKQ